MLKRFEPKIEILPRPQHEIWPLLSPAPKLSLVLYGGTAVALHLGHRKSIDFDFFRSEPLAKGELTNSFDFLRQARVLQEDKNTLVVNAKMPSGTVKISFFGSIDIGRVNSPLQTKDSILLVASMEDLLATKLKVILDRAEAKDYIDIAALLAAGVSLERGLGAFQEMFKQDAALPLKAVGYFEDGDVQSLPEKDKEILRSARDRVRAIPDIVLTRGSLAG